MSVENLKARIRKREHPENVAFWFVRHAESTEQEKVMHDSPLTATGIKEAERIADYLEEQQLNFTHLYSSSKVRSKQTAEIIGAKLGLPVIVKPGLDERDWGEYKDQTWTEVSDRLGKMSFEERYNHVPPGGESWKNMEDRKLAALEEIAQESKDGENIILVDHRGGLRSIMPLLAKAGREKHEKFSVPLGSISKFSFVKDEFDFIGLKPGEK